MSEEQTGKQEALWDVGQAAKFLNVSKSWVYHRLEAGLLPHLRLSGLVRFEPKTLREFARRDRLSGSHVIERLSGVGATRSRIQSRGE